MNKQIVKQTMLSFEASDFESPRAKCLEYVGIEDDEQAQAELASDLSDKIEKLAATDFGPKSKVEESSVVKLKHDEIRFDSLSF